MTERRTLITTDRPQGTRIDLLRSAVRRALPLGTGVLAAGLAIGAVGTTPRAPFPAIFPLASLLPTQGGDGSEGFVLAGIDSSLGNNGGESGHSVSAAGDVNSDGIDDLIVGALFASPGGRSDAGESYVVFGRDTARTGNFPALFELLGLLPTRGGDGSAGFVLTGIHRLDRSGSAVSAAGDVNGDGIGDLIIGAFYADPGGRFSAGESYVVFGRDTAQVGNFPAEFELAKLLPSGGGDGSSGFVVTGIDTYDLSGVSVSAAGDVNGDDVDDLIIGAPNADPRGGIFAGESYVVFGRDTIQAGNFPAVFPVATLLPTHGGDGSAGFVLTGIDASDSSGTSVSAAGDLNGDGIDDLVLGAKAADPGGRSIAGESYVVFGRDTAQAGNFPAQFPLASLLPGGGGDGSAGFVLTGIEAGDNAGWVSAAGDVNSDGIDDLLIGALGASPGGRTRAGESYVVFGRDIAQAGEFPAQFPLESLLPANGGDGSAGFVLPGIDGGDYSGYALSAAGDINGDARDDLIIGAMNADPGGRLFAGESYVVFGRDAAEARNFPAVFPLASLLPAGGGDGRAGFVLTGNTYDGSGYAVSAAGDVNGDGIDDLIIGAPGGQSGAGESYVVFGRSTAPLSLGDGVTN